MPRVAKGAHAVWRKESRKADGSLRSRAQWFIQDGQRRIPIGLDRSQRSEAQKLVAKYLAENAQSSRERDRHPIKVKVAEVIKLYLDEVAPTHRKPTETASRLLKIGRFFHGKTVAEINRSQCLSYVAASSTVPAARRQLEDLRAALKHYLAEALITHIPVITMPEKSQSRLRWLTRDEAARFLRAAWRMTQTWKGRDSDRHVARHVARFFLVGLYTGTRSAAICGAALKPTEGSGWVDLDRGVFHRRALGAAETNKRQPAVRLPRRLMAHIRRWSKTPVEIKYAGRGKSRNIGRMVSHDYVVEWQGEPVLSVRKAFRAVCEEAGLGWYETIGGEQVFKTDVTPHVLRHTAATWAMQAGVKLSDAADYLGMTEKMLRDVYYHSHPDFQAEAADLITRKPRRSAA